MIGVFLARLISIKKFNLRDIMTAEELSKQFAETFLKNGNYEALGASFSDGDTRPASSALNPYFSPDSGFSGLAVHSVGYTQNAETEKVIVYVTRGTQKALRSLPKSVEDIPVIVNVMGRLQATPAPAMAARGLSHFFEHKGRIACGSSCAPSGENYAGTIGALVSDGTQILALSNNHVFAACNHMPIGMPILSPATRDARPDRRAPTEICRHERMIELRSGDPKLVPLMSLDAAVARVPNQDTVTSWQGDEINGYDTPSTVVDLKAEMRVKKFGRTTGFTIGVVEAYIPTPWILPYKSTKFSATVWFENTWTVRSIDGDPFVLGGDSGSLIVTEDGSAAVGLLFAGNNKGDYGIIMPIQDVLNSCGNLQLVSGHGIQ
jgi:hypothetical protein